MNLVELYERYAYQINIKNAKKLLDAVLDYEFDNFHSDMHEIKKIHQLKSKIGSYNQDLSILESNGSTSNNCSTYCFKPNFNFWHNHLNESIRNPYNFLNLQNMQLTHMNYGKEDFKVLYKKEINTIFLIYNFFSFEAYDKLIDFLKKCDTQDNKIISKPNELIPILTNKELSLELSKKCKVIMSSCDMAVLPNTFKSYLNNNMLSWKSGIYFYTCKKNNKHFLPLHYNLDGNNFNILNFSLPLVSESSDFIEYGDKINCDCGRARIDAKFIGHKKNMIEKNNKFVLESFGENITGHYLWLQLFLDAKNELYIAYRSNELKKDIEKFLDILKPNKFHLLKNKKIRIGKGKFPIIWKENNIYQIENLSDTTISSAG